MSPGADSWGRSRSAGACGGSSGGGSWFFSNKEVAPGKFPHHRPLVWLMQGGANGDEETERQGQGSILLSSLCTTVLVVGHQ